MDGLEEGDAIEIVGSAGDRIAAFIRERSARGELVPEGELLALLEDECANDPGRAGAALPAPIAQALRDCTDLQKLTEGRSRFYCSTDFMAEAYAELLLSKRRGPLAMIAEAVRRKGETYGEPLPADLFTLSPFELTEGAVHDAISAMAADPDYADIAATETSAGHIYLYSKRSLEADHAAMLAEWIDVGQVENP